MVATREISGKEFLRDLRSGISDLDLMDKYRLTERGLASVFNKLLEIKAITLSELQARSDLKDEQLDIPAEFRLLPREDLDFPLPVFEKTAPQVRGLVHDITGQGIGVRGIATRHDDVKTFVIAVNEFFRTAPVLVQARCRWAKGKGEPRNFAAGFEIVQVLSGNLEELQKLIRGLTLADRRVLREEQ